MKKKVLLTIFLFILIISTGLLMINKSYSYGLMIELSGNKGSRVLTYYDASTDTKLSYEDAMKYYGVNKYEFLYQGNGKIYFYMGNEITENEYTKGHSIEEADKRAQSYGSNAYRVHTTQEFKNALNDIYNNYKIGTFYIEFSKYENIDFNEINNYYQNNFALKNSYQNYYTYQVKGKQEPERFNIDLSLFKEDGEIYLNTNNIRITGNEQKIVDNFINKLLPLIQKENSDYQKILAAYTYINNTTTYLVDSGYYTELASNTSIYDVFINRKSTCIGYSVAFSYLMDKLNIESYIVDNLETVNPSSGSYYSSHTYNIVKLNNKFYKIDLTGNVFLAGISPNELYNSNLTISTSAYSGGFRSYIFDYETINTYLSQAKATKTTTTKVSTANQTTIKYPYEIPNTTTNKKTTTTKRNDSNTNTTQRYYYNETTTIANQNDLNITGNNSNNNNNYENNNSNYENNYNSNNDSNYNTNEPSINNNTNNITTKTITTTPITKQENSYIDKLKTFKFNFKYDKKIIYILIGIGVILIIIFVIYKIITNKNKVSINSEEVKNILERDIDRDKLEK